MRSNKLTRRCARDHDLTEHSEQIHPPKRFPKKLNTPSLSLDPERCGYDERRCHVHDAIRDPGHHVEGRIGEAGENVGNVSSVEYRLERGENGDPDVRADGDGDELGGEEEEEPGEDGRCGKEELGGDGEKEAEGVDGHEEELEDEHGFHYVEGHGGELWNRNEVRFAQPLLILDTLRLPRCIR